MGGWKTWAAGLLSITTGITAILKEVANGTFDFGHIQAGIMMISTGLAAIGLGHKIEKNGTGAP